MKRPLEEYISRKNDYNSKLKKITSLSNTISNMRLLVFISGLGFSIYLYIIRLETQSILTLFASMALFLVLVVKHEKILRKKRYTEALINVNEMSIKRINGEWKSFEDTGEFFKDGDHPYSEDLDIFGKASLFQWINTAKTHLGQNLLKTILTTTPKDTEEIRKRQDAIKDLAARLDWRQNFQAEAFISSKDMENPENLIKWSKEPGNIIKGRWAAYFFRCLPFASALFALFVLAVPEVKNYFLLIPLFIHILIIAIRYVKYKDISVELSTVGKHKDGLKVYQNMLQLIEEEKFDSDYLNEIKGKLIDKKGRKASEQMEELIKISDMIYMKNSQFYLIINIVALWDYQAQISLQNWKKKSGVNLENWLYVIGMFEALSSLAVINYDHPDWAMPKITADTSYLTAKSMGHPLLGENCVRNDLKIDKNDRILLVTGSNMSGKSTYLRTAGVNLVLAYSGAPVCAEEFTCSLFEIYTSMRIRDDLENNVSSFYAEIIRIKMSIDAAQNGKPVFFLLDEIFRGTNSADRHTGAKALIKMLKKLGAVGLVSTHDLELGELAKTDDSIKNYHFQESYKGNSIHFDYKLRPGISTTRNALYLIRKAGIIIDE